MLSATSKWNSSTQPKAGLCDWDIVNYKTSNQILLHNSFSNLAPFLDKQVEIFGISLHAQGTGNFENILQQLKINFQQTSFKQSKYYPYKHGSESISHTPFI